MTTLGTALTPNAIKVMMLGSGELGKEVVIELQRLGVEVIAVDRYENAPAQQVADAWLASMKDILTVQDQNQIPELNEYQCGTYTEHSLEEAHDIARNVISRGVGINKNDDLALDESFLK